MRWWLGYCCLLAGSTGCGKKEVAVLSDLKMSDGASAKQLIAGFYPLEDNRWRWAARRFAVVLEPPPGATETRTALRLDLYIPDAQVQKLGPITIQADVGDISLSAETFARGGSLLYAREIPSGLFTHEPLPVVFTLDKFIPAGSADGRELGAVVTEVSLVQKR